MVLPPVGVHEKRNRLHESVHRFHRIESFTSLAVPFLNIDLDASFTEPDLCFSVSWDCLRKIAKPHGFE
jgi:hypothetical protein